MSTELVARCPRFSDLQTNTLLDTTRRSRAKRVEMGFNLNGNPDDPDLGERCEGDCHIITLPPRGYHRQFGSFHTHVDGPPDFSRYDVYTALVRWDSHMCVGGHEDGSPVVRCYAVEPGPEKDAAIAESSRIEERRRHAKTAIEATDTLPDIYDFGDRHRGLFREVCRLAPAAARPRQATLF